MKYLLPLVALVGLGVCTCAPRAATPGDRVTRSGGVDYKSFVFIAAVDPASAEHVTGLLDKNGIPNVVEGSVVYGISVPPAMRIRATALLKSDSKKHRYYIRF